MMESEDITMATLDIEEAKEVQSKSVVSPLPLLSCILPYTIMILLGM